MFVTRTAAVFGAFALGALLIAGLLNPVAGLAQAPEVKPSEAGGTSGPFQPVSTEETSSVVPGSGSPEPTPSREPAHQQGEQDPPSSLPPAPRRTPRVRPGPGRIWTLTAGELSLSGVRYHGFATKRVAGRQVRTMHFTVDSMRITDLVQRGLGETGVVRAQAAPGSVSTVTDGPIDLYTRRLTGTLEVAGFPTAPVTLSPESLLLPNLDLSFLSLPRLTFTDAVVRNVELDGGTLYIPGAEIVAR